jgi:hypothetical protein
MTDLELERAHATCVALETERDRWRRDSEVHAARAVELAPRVTELDQLHGAKRASDRIELVSLADAQIEEVLGPGDRRLNVTVHHRSVAWELISSDADSARALGRRAIDALRATGIGVVTTFTAEPMAADHAGLQRVALSMELP